MDSEMRGSALRNVIALGGGLLREGTGDQKNTTCPASLHDGDIVAPLRRRRPARGPHGRRQASTTVTSWPHCGGRTLCSGIHGTRHSSLHDGDVVAPLRRDEIRDYFRSVGLPEPYDETARRKILPEAL